MSIFRRIYFSPLLISDCQWYNLGPNQIGPDEFGYYYRFTTQSEKFSHSELDWCQSNDGPLGGLHVL